MEADTRPGAAYRRFAGPMPTTEGDLMSADRTDPHHRWPTAVMAAAAVVMAITLLLVQSAFGAAIAHTSTPAPTRVLRVLEKNLITNLVDNPPRAAHPVDPRAANPNDLSPGDIAAVTSQIWTTAKPSRRIGTIHELCTVTLAGEHAAATCYGTFVLPSGTLAFNDFFRFADDQHHIAITGGTGAYEAARGSVSGRSSPGNYEINILTIRLFR